MKRTDVWRASSTDKARRTQLAVSAGILALSLQLLLLVGVLDGAPTWVQIVVFTVYVLLIAVVLTMAILNLEEQRASQER
jgi:membrane protein implicated in regulation of membrane protease activity